MKLTVNGESRTFESVATLTELLTALGLDARAVVVEHNRAIVRRPTLAETPVRDGDTIEIVHFVGGG
ncbi:MAG: sulfur carrier protein ThiS [Gemmatimonadales bacterium]|nr:sulfur carrier protein ThiS [Gemmatimonadales bacterium]